MGGPERDRWRVGLVGAGAFGRFVLTALAPLPDVELVAVSARTDASRAAALATWRRSREEAGLPPGNPSSYADPLTLVGRPDLDAVLVATPPVLQPEIGAAVLGSGKALFLEKPGALTATRLRELSALARFRCVAAGMNFVMRASPLIRCVRRWFQAGLLGRPERWHVENWAGGEIPAGHWFWDPAQSGGVLVEHGVHFFDEVAWVLGARPARAWGAGWPHPRRPGLPARAMAVVEYEGPAWHLVASFYHGFVREGEEHQIRELGFAAGWLRIDGWIPRRVTGELDLAPEAAQALRAIAAEELGLEATTDPPRLRVLALGGGRFRVEADLTGGGPTYREMIRRGFLALRGAAAGRGEPLAPLDAGAGALAVAEAARGDTWRPVEI